MAQTIVSRFSRFCVLTVALKSSAGLAGARTCKRQALASRGRCLQSRPLGFLRVAPSWLDQHGPFTAWPLDFQESHGGSCKASGRFRHILLVKRVPRFQGQGNRRHVLVGGACARHGEDLSVVIHGGLSASQPPLRRPCPDLQDL